jgi:tetratricopeptide (TPR) repeat protein
LGNIGNLQRDMGDMNAAFETYQKVLAMEASRLGPSHPDVIVTLHNIATIDAARGNHKQALALYQQVIDAQTKVFGENHLNLAVSMACKGDVFERIGEMEPAIDCFEEALRIKSSALGRHSIEVARILHKLGKLNAQNKDFQVAESFISRSILVYRLNKLPEDDEWLVDAHRDAANIDGAISMRKRGAATKGINFEC